MRKFIHYGHKEFNKKLFNSIKNRITFTKPNGGLWASDINAKYGWKDWCENNNFRECNLENSFEFSITPDARVLTINNVEILKDLPKIKNNIIPTSMWCFLDFEKLSKSYDVIEVNISADRDLYWELYGWDCDSILVMNPSVIVE